MRSMKALLIASAMGLSTLSASAAGPFDGLAGEWRGGGTVSLSDGSSERLRCVAKYDVAGSTLKLRMACATDSFKVDAHSDVRYSDGFLSGHWTETTRNLGGDVSGSASGNTIKANLESGDATLFALTIVTSGNVQNARIVTQPGAPIKNVQINLTRQ